MWPFLPPLSPFTTTIWIFYWLVHSVGHGCPNWIIGWIEPKYFCRMSVAIGKIIKNWQNIKKNLIYYILQMEILRKDQKTRVVTNSGTRVHHQWCLLASKGYDIGVSLWQQMGSTRRRFCRLRSLVTNMASRGLMRPAIQGIEGVIEN